MNNLIEYRWEQGIEHHPRAIEILQGMAKLDTKDETDLKFGGDGDNGETLLYLMSEFLEKKEKKCH